MASLGKALRGMFFTRTGAQVLRRYPIVCTSKRLLSETKFEHYFQTFKVPTVRIACYSTVLLQLILLLLFVHREKENRVRDVSKHLRF